LSQTRAHSQSSASLLSNLNKRARADHPRARWHVAQDWIREIAPLSKECEPAFHSLRARVRNSSVYGDLRQLATTQLLF
jgi:hypothetical protein